MAAYAADDVGEDLLVQFLRDVAIVAADDDPRAHPRWDMWWRFRNSLRSADIPGRHEDDVWRLRSFDRPVLAFKGLGSTGFEREIVDLIGELVPNASVVELGGAHMLPIVSKDVFLRTLRGFLAASAHVRAQDPPHL